MSATEKPPEAVVHPLEPLTAEEISAAVDVLRAERNLADSYRFVSVVLHEPSKDHVLSFWDEGSIDREAFVVLLDNSDGSAY